MEKSKEIVNKAGIVPKLQLAVQLTDEFGNKKGVKGTGPHLVKLIGDKVVKGVDYQTSEDIYKVEYLLEEKGEKKVYFVPVKDKQGDVHYLVQRLAEIPEGTEIVLEYKRRGKKGYIEVKNLNGENEISPEDDIPVINDEDESQDIGESGTDADIPF